MAKAKATSSPNASRKMRPALTPESRENQLISLAVDLVEQRLIDGTASAQEVTHFLKLASSTERLEKRIKEQQANMLEAKTSQLKSMANQEEMYAQAIKAMRSYQGFDMEQEEED